MQSRPPSPIIPQFREWLKLLGKESCIDSWSFRRGMFFNDHIEWWGAKCRRRTVHEGIDFAEILLPDGTVQRLPEGMPVHALAVGEIVAFLDDFLNKTVVVRHPAVRNENGDIFFTFYSHINPIHTTPAPVSKGQILGNVGKSKRIRSPGSSAFDRSLDSGKDCRGTHLDGFDPSCIHADRSDQFQQSYQWAVSSGQPAARSASLLTACCRPITRRDFQCSHSPFELKNTLNFWILPGPFNLPCPAKASRTESSQFLFRTPPQASPSMKTPIPMWYRMAASLTVPLRS